MWFVKNIFLIVNLLAMMLVALLIVLGVRFALNSYTHHGEAIEVPSLRGETLIAAASRLEVLDLRLEVSDTSYMKGEPAGAILAQTPDAGSRVKSGRTIYVTVNASHSPTIVFPDIVDNSSVREATAKLRAMGLKVTEPERVAGERDWVYGAKADGRPVTAGDRISKDATITIQVGDGYAEGGDSLSVIDEDNIGGGYYGHSDSYEEIEIDGYTDEIEL